MTLLNIVYQAMEEKKGQNIQVIDFKNRSVLTDAFVICDAASLRQVNAIVDAIVDAVEKNNFVVKHIEGGKESRWVLIDCYDVIAHVFVSGEREIYQLENLWADYLKLT